MTVKVHGADSLGQPFSQTASVMDVSESGVRLEGVHVLYRAGQMAMLEHDGSRAQYRVVWVGGGALAGQAGLMSLGPEKPTFNLRFPPSGPDKYLVPPPERQGFDGIRQLLEQRRQAENRKDERRRYPRYACRGEVEICVESAEFPEHGKLTDLSRGGCFVELLPSITLDTKVTLVLLISQRKIRVRGIVKSVLPNFGLGVQFLHFEPEDLQRLEAVIAALEQGTPLNAIPPPAPPPVAAPVTRMIDPQRALELVKSWFGDHDFLTRQEFLLLLKKTAPKGP
jgi:hypothetical protein